MASIIYSLQYLMRCLAIILLATLPLAKARVVLSDEQHALLQQQPANNRAVSARLFADLEESARLADIAYCVGTTGIHNPFECLSHCEGFNGFELITVRRKAQIYFNIPQANLFSSLLDVEHRATIIRLVRLYRSIALTLCKTNNRCISWNLLVNEHHYRSVSCSADLCAVPSGRR